MIKIVGTGMRGAKTVMFGLSYANLDRLRAGQPIRFSGAEIGVVATEFVIFAGETEQAMAREVETLIGPNTNVRFDFIVQL